MITLSIRIRYKSIQDSIRVFRIIGMILLLLAKNTYAQTEKLTIKNTPLSTALDQLKRYYNIRFSYADETIKNKQVSLAIQTNAPIIRLLASIQKQTNLRLEMVNDQYIIIRPFNSNDRFSICGYVWDQNQMPAIGAAIQIKGDQSGTVADLNGFFQIDEVLYSETISISYVGFHSKEIKVTAFIEDVCKLIKLDENVEYLDEVVIKDYITAGSVKKNQKIEFSIQNLNMLPGMVEPDVLRSIQLTPGVSSPFETANGIYIRGGAPDQNLIRWNGIKTYEQGHFFGMLSAFNPYIVEKVDFIKQGTSARYGDRISGVIDIATNQEVVQKTEGGAGFDMIYGDIHFKTPLTKKLTLQGAARRSFTDAWETPTYEKMAERVFQNTKITDESSLNTPGATNTFFFNDLNFDLIAQPGPKEKWMASLLYNENDLEFRSSSLDEDASFNDFLRTANSGYNIRWNRQLNEQLSFSTNTYYSQHLLDYEFQNRTGDIEEVSSKKNLVSDFGADIQTQLKSKGNNIFTAGYQFSNNRIQYAFENRSPSYSLVLDAADNTINTHSIYSEYEHGQWKKTFVSAGVRYNYYSGVKETFIEPRIYLRRQVGKFLAINSSAEYRSQVASQIQESVVSDLSLENKVWTLARKDTFPVIDSYQFTVGANFNKNEWFLDLDTYLKKINGITTRTFGFLNPFDNESRIGTSDIIGLDLFIKRKFSIYNTWLSYSFIRSQNEFTGLNNDEPFPGNWNIEHTIKWSHFYQWKGIHFTMGWTWHTGKSFTEVMEDTEQSGPVAILFNGINTANLPIYHRMDFSMIYNFHFKKNQKINYRIGISLQNLYDRKNILNQEFRTTPTLENELISTRIYSLGFTPNLVFRVFW